MIHITPYHLHKFALLLAIIIFSVGLSANPNSFVVAAEKVEFVTNDIHVDFPDGIEFMLTTRADEQIQSVTLEYGTNKTSCVRSIARQPVDIEPSNIVIAKWVWDFKDSGSLPMGVEVTWVWEVKLTSGEVVRSPLETQTIIDQRFTWKQTDHDPSDLTSVNLWYHDTSESFAKELAVIGQKALQKTQADFSVTPARAVQIILYNNADEVYESGLFLSEWVGGYAVADYSLVVIGVEEGDTEWGQEVIEHELAHLISDELVANCLAVFMPTWLSEGFSTYSEGGVDPAEQENVKKSLAADTLPPLRNLAAGFPANDASARLSYAQSGMIVDFMIQEYGADKLPHLFAEIQAGTLVEDGLRNVYNLDVDGLDNAWRASLGFAMQGVLPTPTGTPPPTSVPTLQLFAPFDATATPVPTSTATQPVEVIASPTAESGSGTQTTPSSSSGPSLPCLGGNAALMGLFLAFLFLVYRRK